MSIRFSSRLTGSPSFLCQSSRVASATDSESCGTFTSTIIAVPRSVFPRLRLSFHRVHEKPASNSPGLSVFAEGLLYQLLLPFVMACHVAGRGRRRGRTAGVEELLLVAHVLPQVVPDLVPRALVLRLFLAPDHFSGVGIALHLGLELLVRERVELLDPDD